jgi:hypothetical protein
MFRQVYGYDATGQKRTASDAGKLSFLASLPAGATVWEERDEWERGQQWTVCKVIGRVVPGNRPGVKWFERSARWFA